MDKCKICKSENVYYSKKRNAYICEDCDHVEPVVKDDAQKVFFSYGHTETSQLVFRIKNSLEALGYQIWIDVEGIKTGADWREKITSAIVSSNKVLAFLSGHALREDSVCMNELAIAASLKRDAICPVELEPKIIDKTPSYIQKRLCCEMADWKEKFGDEHWYAKRLEDIITMLANSDENESALSFISNYFDCGKVQNKLLCELGKPFIARKWLDELLGEWLSENHSRCLLVSGCLGAGKTDYFIHQLHFDSRFASIICVDDIAKEANPTYSVVYELIMSLSLKISSYRIRLLHAIYAKERYYWDTLSVDKVIESLLLKCMFGEIDSKRDATVIVFDGIDEIGDFGIRDDILLVLSKIIPQMPDFIKFVFTSSADASAIKSLIDCKEICLSDYKELCKQDIAAFVNENLAVPCTDEESRLIASTLSHDSNGSFLYASLVVQALNSREMELNSIKAIPKSLSRAYAQMFACFLKSDYSDPDYMKAVGAVIYALGDLPVDFIKKLCGWKERALRSFLSRTSFFVSAYEYEDTFCLMCSHLSYKDWLTSADAGMFQVYKDDAVSDVAATMYKSLQEGTMLDYEIEYILDYQKMSSDSKFLEVALNDEYFLKVVELIDTLCSENGSLKRIGRLIALGESLISLRQDNSDMDDEKRRRYETLLLVCRCKLEYISQNYDIVIRSLINAMDIIKSVCNRADVLHAEYILADSLDIVGQRSLAYSTLLTLKEDSQHYGVRDYYFKSLLGLIWNCHFNNLNQGFEFLAEAKKIDCDSQDAIALSIAEARLVLSKGDTEQAIKIYESIFSGNSPFAVKKGAKLLRNRLGILEILVAYYDNLQFVKAIELGGSLIDIFGEHEWMEKSYLLSWVALCYLGLGNLEKARLLLNQARAQNLNYVFEKKSDWLHMHHNSIEASILMREKKIDETIARKKDTIVFAGKNNDYWVRGDALFDKNRLEALYLGIYNEDEVEDLLRSAKANGFPHLIYKAGWLLTFIRAKKGCAISEYPELTYDTLPSVNVLDISELAFLTASELKLCEKKQEAAQYFEACVQKLISRNPGTDCYTSFYGVNISELRERMNE